jgi:peptidoglycan LD-endopeptidase CwlK
LIFLTLLAYFALIAFGAILYLFPERRAWLITTISNVMDAGCAPFSRLAQNGINQAQGAKSTVVGTLQSWGNAVRTNPIVALAALILFASPVVLVVLFRGPTIFDFNDTVYVADKQIAVLLEGEQLVPPPSLPPEVFTTKEVELVRPDIVNASRNWKLLDPEFTQRLLVVFKLMKERHGYDMALLEGYRTPERQAQLAAKGSHVTQAGPNMSYHQYGLAADCAFFRDGKIVISEQDPWAMRGYELYGEVAEQVGLTWGGRWKMHDLGHVELKRKGVLGSAR